ncbi:MAG: SGNH/GDSL hydrolase family protein [Selenomonadaceae bacterium]|nr:SGNH/GDSL hydrolase family protein [Selenomonadaceae bacterium]
MMKILPVILAIFLSLANFQIFDKDESTEPIENKNPRNHLTQDSSNRQQVTAQVLSVSEAAPKNVTINHTEEKVAEEIPEVEPEEKIFRLTWQIVPRAVKYKISYEGKTAVSYTNGVEIPIKNVNNEVLIVALDFDNKVVENDVVLLSIEENPPAPLTTTEFDKMKLSPVYVVYSWIPTINADHYEIQLFKDGELFRDYVTDFHPKDDNFDYYDEEPMLEEGEYFWRIRGIAAGGAPLTDWSEKNPGNTFTVEKPAAFCALGDSITHGGGSISVPPSTVVYNWQNYCSIPIKNFGKSGDTTEKMLERFEQDILSFSPEILFIMAGVNDYRGDILGWDSVENLAAIRDKCESYGIKPVFITPTPLNPNLIGKINFIHRPPYDWQEQRKYICDWMRRQENCIDIANDFSDENGFLRADLALDGLHPDAEGKEIIGRAVENWLTNYLNSK